MFQAYSVTRENVTFVEYDPWFVCFDFRYGL
jgi:hypothetical protein